MFNISIILETISIFRHYSTKNVTWLTLFLSSLFIQLLKVRHIEFNGIKSIAYNHFQSPFADEYKLDLSKLAYGW